MSTLADAARFALDSDMRQPITAGIVAAAVQIMAEDGSTPGHAERTTLAADVLRDPLSYSDSFAWAVSTNATVLDEWVAGNIDGAINDLAYTISSVWNAIAGISQPSV